MTETRRRLGEWRVMASRQRWGGRDWLGNYLAAVHRPGGALKLTGLRENIESCVEHDINCHRTILKASQNDVLVRVWDTWAIDLRIRAVIGKISEDMRDVVESHQPIVDALEKGRGREAGLLLRNHVETFSEYIKKSESDSGFHRALRRDLEGAKDVQQAFFPSQNLSIP